MAFTASHPTQHDVALRVAESTVCHDKPVWIGVGNMNVYLSRVEAAKLVVDLLNAMESSPVDVGTAA